MQRIGTLVLAVLALAACGDDIASGDNAIGEAVTVDHAWARATVPGQPSGAIYFDLTVRDDDTLVGVSVPSSVAAGAEIHEVVVVGASEEPADPSMDEMPSAEGSHDMEMEMDMDMDGAMRMEELADGLALIGGETVSFEPGSFHVMMPELASPLEIGDEFELTLDFATAPDVTVAIVVAENAP